MALGVNQTYKNYYTIRLGSLTTQHQIQSNRITLYTNEVTDIAQRVNFFEGQKTLTLSTPDNSKLAISAKYFNLPAGFDPSDQNTWGGANHPFYTTPCQKELFIYKKLTDAEYGGLPLGEQALCVPSSDGAYYQKISYLYDASGNPVDDPDDAADPDLTTDDQEAIYDSNVLSNRLMSGSYSFVYMDDTMTNQLVSYKDLMFVHETEDKASYTEAIQMLEAERDNINKMQNKVQGEMTTTETEISALQSMMESTDKILQKNTETFKWGA